MAEIGTVTGSSVVGSQRNTYGTLAATSTSGTVTTGMKYVNTFVVNSSTAVEAEVARVRLNHPSGGVVTLDYSSSDYAAGNWSAIGYGGG